MSSLLAWLVALPAGWLYAVIAVAALMENVFPPLPADTVIALGAFVAHQGFIAADVHLTMADSHLDPLCTVPVALGIPSILARRIQPYFMLTLWAVACFTAALAVAFEVWIPNVDTRFTADPIDVLAYFTGAGIWRFVEPLGR